MILDLIVLKGILSDKKIANDFISENNISLFAIEYWDFSKVITDYIKAFKDVPTLNILCEKFEKNQNRLNNIKKIWNLIEQEAYDIREFKFNVEKLKKRFAEKQVLNIQDSLNKLDPNNIDISKVIGEINKTAQNIKELNKNKAYERKTLKDSVSLFRDEYNAKLKNPEFNAGIKTGYSALDDSTGGLNPGELLLIGGESNSGKSMLLMNMAIQMWLQKNTINTLDNFSSGNNVLYFSLEMPFRPCLNRVLGRLSENPTKLIKSAQLNSDQAIKLKQSLKFINKYPYQFEIVDIPRGATMENMERVYEDAKIIYNPQVVVIDYLGLMDYEGEQMEDWLKLGKISEKIHEFARVHNCIVLSAVQLNRAKPGKEEDKIGMHRIGRSALIMQNANIALQIETRPNEKNFLDMKYHLIKVRDGALLSGTLMKNLSCGTLTDNFEENTTEFYDKNYDDISEKIELLGI